MLVYYAGIAPRAAATVRVVIHGTWDPVLIFADQFGTTALGNPFTADVISGAYRFWAEDDNVLDVVIEVPVERTPLAVPLDTSVLALTAAGVSPDRTMTLYGRDPDDATVLVPLVAVVY